MRATLQCACTTATRSCRRRPPGAKLPYLPASLHRISTAGERPSWCRCPDAPAHATGACMLVRAGAVSYPADCSDPGRWRRRGPACAARGGHGCSSDECLPHTTAVQPGSGTPQPRNSTALQQHSPQRQLATTSRRVLVMMCTALAPVHLPIITKPSEGRSQSCSNSRSMVDKLCGTAPLEGQCLVLVPLRVACRKCMIVPSPL